MIRLIFTARFSCAVLDCLCLRVGGATYIKYGEETGQSLAFPVHLLDFRHVASFQNQTALSSTVRLKTEAKFHTFFTPPPVKLWEGYAKCLEWWFQTKGQISHTLLAWGQWGSWEVQQIFQAQISGGNIVAPVCQRWESKLYQIFEGHRTVISIPETVSYTHLTLPTIYSV